MECPKCKKRMATTHTYSVGDCSTHRLACEDQKCNTVVTAVMVLVNTDPMFGAGASKLANELAAKEKAQHPLERLLQVLRSSPLFSGLRSLKQE